MKRNFKCTKQRLVPEKQIGKSQTPRVFLIDACFTADQGGERSCPWRRQKQFAVLIQAVVVAWLTWQRLCSPFFTWCARRGTIYRGVRQPWQTRVESSIVLQVPNEYPSGCHEYPQDLSSSTISSISIHVSGRFTGTWVACHGNWLRSLWCWLPWHRRVVRHWLRQWHRGAPWSFGKICQVDEGGGDQAIWVGSWQAGSCTYKKVEVGGGEICKGSPDQVEDCSGSQWQAQRNRLVEEFEQRTQLWTKNTLFVIADCNNCNNCDTFDTTFET